MIEATLTLMVFTVILFSLIDFGSVFFMHQTLVNRARAAARYGALHPDDVAGVRSYVLYNQPTGSGPGMFGVQMSNVTATRTGAGTIIADRMTVTVSGYSFGFVTPGNAGPKTGKAITVSVPIEAN